MNKTPDREQLRKLIADTIDVDLAEVTDTADFREELEVDSLMSLEVMVVLEQTYHIKLSQDDMKDVHTFDDAAVLLNRALDAQGA